ncbi:hypothetical protein G6L37_04095 [Agrobacterium rubi]|nr:hypothetical protein [Agrobacterium rubi]NTF24532.1 hypothetical protein [Agrobacterium rubi]
MNAMLLLVAILFALIAVAGYNLVTMNQAFNISASIQQNHSRVQIVTSSIRTALTVVDGKVAIPVSSDLTAYVPDVAPFRNAPNGTPYVYCPILTPPAASSAVFNNASASESYPVDMVERSGTTYVVAGRPGGVDDLRISALGVVAYVLTSQPNNPQPLRCADVRLAGDGTTLLVPGGSVSAVYDNPVTADGASFVMSPDGSRPATAATSDRIARSLDDVVGYVSHYDVNDIRIRISGGETFKASELSALFAITDGRTVRLQGPEGMRAVVTVDEDQQAGGLVELMPRGRAVLSNISLKGAAGGDVAIASAPGGSVVIRDGQVSRVRSNGGEIVLSGTTRIVPISAPSATLNPVIADGGSIVFDVTDSSDSPAISSQSSVAVFEARGGEILIKSTVHAVAGAAAELFSSVRGNLRIGSSSSDILVDRGNGFNIEEYNVLQRVSTSCADGDSACTASCPPATRVAWGECGSSNGAALAGFGVDATGGQYTCQWAQMTVAISPKAAVVCQPR